MSSTSQSHRTTRLAGFTLVELLVVIGIIAVLISILLPSLQKAKASADAVKCMSNMKQIALATQMYRNEHNDYFPPLVRDFSVYGGYALAPLGTPDDPQRWFHFLEKYTRTFEVFNCPSRTAWDPRGAVKNQPSGTWLRGQSELGASCNTAYARWIGGFMIQNTASTAKPNMKKFGQIKSGLRGSAVPADVGDVGVFMDGQYWMTTAEVTGSYADYHAKSKFRFIHGKAQPKDGTCNVAFLDSHVEGVRFDQVRDIPWDSANSHTRFLVKR